MFKEITLINHKLVGRVRHYYFELFDRDFREQFVVHVGYANDPSIVVELIKIYKRRNRHVVRELARYYAWLHKGGWDVPASLSSHYRRVDALDQTIQYNKLYYQLLTKVYLGEIVRQ